MGRQEMKPGTGTNSNPIQSKPRSENEVFVSYAWGGESERIVDEMEPAFQARGIHLVRDKRDLPFRGSIQEFERRIGQGQCIVLVISDKYLRSEHCMYELLEVSGNQNLRERIFPIVLPDAKIYDPVARLRYVKYWDRQIQKLKEAIRQVDVPADLDGIHAELNKYVHIRASFDHLTDTLRDMNALTPEKHVAGGFSALVGAVEGAMKETGNIPQTRGLPEPEKRENTGKPARGYKSARNVAVILALLLIVLASQLTRMIYAVPPSGTPTSMPVSLPATGPAVPLATSWPLGDQTTTDSQHSCSITISDAPELGRERAKALQFSVTGQGGYCSWVVPLQGYNASGKKQVTFWVKGTQGGEAYKVGLKDWKTSSGLEPKEPQTAPASWTQVSIPLDRFENLDLSSLENFSLNFTAGSGTIYVDQLIFMP